jgi:hypothetical protein
MGGCSLKIFLSLLAELFPMEDVEQLKGLLMRKDLKEFNPELYESMFVDPPPSPFLPASCPYSLLANSSASTRSLAGPCYVLLVCC